MQRAPRRRRRECHVDRRRALLDAGGPRLRVCGRRRRRAVRHTGGASKRCARRAPRPPRAPPRFVFAGVFDGHNGDAVSEFLRRHLCARLLVVLAEERAYTRRAALLLQRGVLPAHEAAAADHAGHHGATRRRFASGSAEAAAVVPAALSESSAPAAAPASPLAAVAAQLTIEASLHPAQAPVALRSLGSSASSNDATVPRSFSCESAPPSATVAASPALGLSLRAPAFSHGPSDDDPPSTHSTVEHGAATAAAAAVVGASLHPAPPAPNLHGHGGTGNGGTHYAPGEPDFRRIMQVT